MFNPIKAAAGLFNAVSSGAKLAAKAKIMMDRATDDTDANGQPQYKDILQQLREMKDRIAVTKGAIRSEWVFYKPRLTTLWKLSVDLFKHVFNNETVQLIAAANVERVNSGDLNPAENSEIV